LAVASRSEFVQRQALKTPQDASRRPLCRGPSPFTSLERLHGARQIPAYGLHRDCALIAFSSVVGQASSR
jgi:hypothetical protein